MEFKEIIKRSRQFYIVSEEEIKKFCLMVERMYKNIPDCEVESALKNGMSSFYIENYGVKRVSVYNGRDDKIMEEIDFNQYFDESMETNGIIMVEFHWVNQMIYILFDMSFETVDLTKIFESSVGTDGVSGVWFDMLDFLK